MAQTTGGTKQSPKLTSSSTTTSTRKKTRKTKGSAGGASKSKYRSWFSEDRAYVALTKDGAKCGRRESQKKMAELKREHEDWTGVERREEANRIWREVKSEVDGPASD